MRTNLETHSSCKPDIFKFIFPFLSKTKTTVFLGTPKGPPEGPSQQSIPPKDLE